MYEELDERTTSRATRYALGHRPMMSTRIPIIDLAPWFTHPADAQRTQVAQQLSEAFESTGFAVLLKLVQNRNISPYPHEPVVVFGP